MTNKPVRTRFAPSPTGFVHIGNFRTALFAYLFARHNDGTAILRIEDTDQTRKIEGALESLLRVMNRFGLQFDEGYYLDGEEVKERGNHGPYLQSDRLSLYQKYADQLLANGAAYHCFCSAERLEDVRKEQMALKKPPMYDRYCRNISADERERLMDEFRKEGKSPVIRQAIPQEGSITYTDLVYGEITIENNILDDQVLIKSDGYPTYHMAVVIDDHLMEITHTIRGQEYLSSTPKHVLLYQALGWEVPTFAHLPLILNPDKSKLSKRQGDVAVEDFLNKGYLTEALLNFVALLGWNPKTEQELFSLEELIAQFDFEKVNKAGAIFDAAKLDWINGLYIRQIPNRDLVEVCAPWLEEAGYHTSEFSTDFLEAIIQLEKDRLKKLADISERSAFYFGKPQYDGSLLVWRKSTASDAKQNLLLLAEELGGMDAADLKSASLIEERLKAFIASRGLDNGSVLWPMRVALTGLEKSPGPFDVAATIAIGWGRDEVVLRLQEAAQKLD